MQSKSNGNVVDKKLEQVRSLLTTVLGEVKGLNSLKTVEVRDGIDFDLEVRRFEINLIERALDETGGNLKSAAELLNIKYTTFHEKVKRYRIRSKNGKRLREETGGRL